MAAGLGFKTFTTGEVLTAADVNGYLMQGILVFATEAARNSAITSPQEGQFAFTKDNNSLWYYTGSAWVASGATGDIEGVTAGVGISGGGTSGTVTITNDMATTITASGDIVVGTGNGTYDNLPIGSTGEVLTADTTVSPYKVKWAALASGTTFAGARVKKTGSQTISNNTTTTLTWNSEDFDTNTYHDNSTNNSRFTIPSGKAGYYNIIANIAIGGSNAGARVIEIYKNTTRIDRVDREPVTNQNMILTSTIFDFAVGDYIEAKIYQDSGGNIDVVTDSRFSIAYLGA